MLQATSRRILSLGMTMNGWETTGDPNGHDHRGAIESRDLASRQDVTSGQEDRCHDIWRCQGHLKHPEMPGHSRDVTDVRTGSNEDIRMDGFHYLLSLWSTQIVLSY